MEGEIYTILPRVIWKAQAWVDMYFDVHLALTVVNVSVNMSGPTFPHYPMPIQLPIQTWKL